jgi:hypothetical protein
MNRKILKKLTVAAIAAMLASCSNSKEGVDSSSNQGFMDKISKSSNDFSVEPMTLDEFANSRDDIVFDTYTQNANDIWYYAQFPRKDGDGKAFAMYKSSYKPLVRDEYLAIVTFHEVFWPDGVETLGGISLGDSQEETLEKFSNASRIAEISGDEAYDIKKRYFESQGSLFNGGEGSRENDTYYYIEGEGYSVLALFGDGILNDICFRLPY